MKTLILQAWILAAQLFDRVSAKDRAYNNNPPVSGGLTSTVLFFRSRLQPYELKPLYYVV
jgi:hypothetical protein